MCLEREIQSERAQQETDKSFRKKVHSKYLERLLSKIHRRKECKN
jgi:hypothetical protein